MRSSANRKIVLKPAQIDARINYGMPPGFFTLDNIKGNGMLDIVQGFDPVSAEPKAHEISAGFEKDFAEEETGARRGSAVVSSATLARSGSSGGRVVTEAIGLSKTPRKR
jgi:hypothetical protein